MVFQPKTYSVLLVSSSRKFAEVTKELLPVTDYWPVRSAGSEAEARRLMLENEYDIAIINSPLSDDSGFSLAEDISSGSDTAVLLLAPAEVYEDIYFKLLPSGVVTAPKPTSQRLISYSLRVLAAMRETDEGRDAAVIGTVSDAYPGRLVMETAFGGKRILQKLTGAQLPRIC